MKDFQNINDILKIKKLENEYDLKKASLLERKLRLMMNESPDLLPLRKKLRDLIKEYEDREWSDFDKLTDSKLTELENAEELVANEQQFIHQRKLTIRKRLKKYDLSQQDLGVILGHPKSYMSELINGVSQFTLKDLVIIHRLLKIDLEILIPTFLQSETRDKVRKSILKLNKPKLDLKKTEFA
ncbi:helix-turn-helix domain-containing protein [Roseimarinus sediminis]|uniref:helix-turn-helix domain-containing protein n=1 Tax=Roseimarinus sediminis TaxID=1610899 RepID=UPI003D1C57AA